MADLPTKFRKAGEAAVASYDWTDIASGIGRVTVYGAAANESVVYFLTSQQIFSDPLVSRETYSSVTAQTLELTRTSYIIFYRSWYVYDYFSYKSSWFVK